MQQEILARVQASPFRRIAGVMMLGVLAWILVYLALVYPPQTVFLQAMLILIAAGALWIAWRMYESTGHYVFLTQEGVFESSGYKIADIQDIHDVDRGTFAFKPSNGFLIRLNKMGRTEWRPGLWWSWRKTIAIGGVTPRHQSKQMADALAMILIEDKI